MIRQYYSISEVILMGFRTFTLYPTIPDCQTLDNVITIAGDMGRWIGFWYK